MWFQWKNFTRRKLLPLENIIPNEETKPTNTLVKLGTLGTITTFGIGAFIIIGYVTKYITGPSVILSIALASAVAILSGLFYSELGARISNSSTYTYSYICIGEFIAFVIGWNLILEYVIGMAAVSKGIGLYLDVMLNDTLKSIFHEIAPIELNFLSSYFDFFGFALPIVFGISLIIGLRNSSIINMIIFAAAVIITGTIIVFAIIKGEFANWMFDSNNLHYPDQVQFFPYGLTGMFTGTAIFVFIFISLDFIAISGIKIQQPNKTIPIANVFIVCIVGILVCAVAMAQSVLWPFLLQDENAALPTLFSNIDLNPMKWILSVFVIIFLLSSLFGLVSPILITLDAMAEDNLIFKIMGRRNFGLFAACIIAGIFAGLFNIGQLINFLSIGLFLAFISIAISIIVLRYSIKLEHDATSTTTLDVAQTAMNNVLLNGGKVSCSSVIMELFSCRCKSKPTETSHLIFSTFLCILCLFCLALALMLRFASDNLYNLESWAMGLSEAFLVVIILSILVISLRPQVPDVTTFTIPLVPLLPAISIFVNIYLMLMLSEYAWIRLGVWLIIGIPIYIMCSQNNKYKETNKQILPTLKEQHINNGFLPDIESQDNKSSKTTIDIKNVIDINREIIDEYEKSRENVTSIGNSIDIVDVDNDKLNNISKQIISIDKNKNLSKKQRSPIPRDEFDEIKFKSTATVINLQETITNVTTKNVQNEEKQVEYMTEQEVLQYFNDQKTSPNNRTFDEIVPVSKIVDTLTEKKEPNGKIYFIEENNKQSIVNGNVEEKEEHNVLAVLDGVLENVDVNGKNSDNLSNNSIIETPKIQSITEESSDPPIPKSTTAVIHSKSNENINLIDDTNSSTNQYNFENSDDLPPPEPEKDYDDNLYEQKVIFTSIKLNDKQDSSEEFTDQKQSFKDKLTMIIALQSPIDANRQYKLKPSKSETDLVNFESNENSITTHHTLKPFHIPTNDDTAQQTYEIPRAKLITNDKHIDNIPPPPKFDPVLYQTISKYDHKRSPLRTRLKNYPSTDYNANSNDNNNNSINNDNNDYNNNYKNNNNINNNNNNNFNGDEVDNELVSLRNNLNDSDRLTDKDPDIKSNKWTNNDNIDDEDNEDNKLNRMLSIKDRLELILQRGPPNRYSRQRSVPKDDVLQKQSIQTNNEIIENEESTHVTNDIKNDEIVDFKEARKPFDTVHKQKVLFNDVLKSINPDARPSLIRSNSPAKRKQKPTSIESARKALKPLPSTDDIPEI